MAKAKRELDDVDINKIRSIPVPPYLSDADAKIVFRELMRVEKKHGFLTGEIVLQEAQEPKSRLHRFFEWDNSAAADRWRLHQAGQLIRAVYIQVREEVVMRELIPVRIEEEGKPLRRYVPIQFIDHRPDMQEQVIRNAWQQIINWRERFIKLRDRWPNIFKAIEDIGPLNF